MLTFWINQELFIKRRARASEDENSRCDATLYCQGLRVAVKCGPREALVLHGAHMQGAIPHISGSDVRAHAAGEKEQVKIRMPAEAHMQGAIPHISGSDVGGHTRGGNVTWRRRRVVAAACLFGTVAVTVLVVNCVLGRLAPLQFPCS